MDARVFVSAMLDVGVERVEQFQSARLSFPKTFNHRGKIQALKQKVKD